MKKSYGVHQILNMEFDMFDMTEEWINTVGHLEKPFSMLVIGPPKNGKTHFLLKFLKALAPKYKVYYNSIEEGRSSTIRNAFRNVGMGDLPPGRFMLGDGDTYEEMVLKLRRNGANIVVIDSQDYLKMTLKQWTTLLETYKNKSFIMVGWLADGKEPKPMDAVAKKIQYRVGVYVVVKNHIAKAIGRYGTTKPYVIWTPPKEEKQTVGQASLF